MLAHRIAIRGDGLAMLAIGTGQFGAARFKGQAGAALFAGKGEGFFTVLVGLLIDSLMNHHLTGEMESGCSNMLEGFAFGEALALWDVDRLVMGPATVE